MERAYRIRPCTIIDFRGAKPPLGRLLVTDPVMGAVQPRFEFAKTRWKAAPGEAGRRLLSDDPLQCLAFVTLVIGLHLRMQKHSDRAKQPMLPVVRGDDRDALYLLLVVFYESGVIFESRNIFPTVESGSIDQQPDLPMLSDESIDLRRNLKKVGSFQFLRRDDPQRIVGDNFGLDHANLLCGQVAF
jgi:hypothetical protein